MGEPRYYVRLQHEKPEPRAAVIHYAFVRDSWYCHWDIARFESRGGGNYGMNVLRQAEALCATLNAEHEASL